MTKTPETAGETSKAAMQPSARLLAEPPRVISVGLGGFAQELAAQGVDVVHVDWTPPAAGDPQLARLLGKLGT